jgi:uncharacterized protein (TIGR03067 family)
VRNVSAIRILLLFFAVAAFARAAEITADARALQGTWAVAGMLDNGNAAPENSLDGARAVFSGDRMTLISPDGREKTEYTIRVDATRTPATIDLTRSDGTFAGQSSNGIYDLDGRTLRICAPHRPGSARPTRFMAPAESGLFLIVLRRLDS